MGFGYLLLNTYLILMFFTGVIATEIRQNFFHSDIRYDNLLPISEALQSFNASSVTECASNCFRETGCVSLFYKEEQCIGWDTRMDDIFPTIISTDTRYYELRGIYGNVAAGRPAVQSTLFPAFSGTYWAFKAVDGSRYPVAFAPDDSCSCTLMPSLEWWRVDLVNTYLITDVAILKRRDDLFGVTITNISIDIAPSVGGPYTNCYTTGPTFNTMRFETFTCGTPVTGRYVKLSKLVVTYLCLCEVEIYVQA
ncbi:fucolectin-1-like [Argopecten irradians]|uniref:fucolectin-1-like n=1 Tax=Argopecten irradians TaxID=31199 RepID=UPI0037174C8A